MSIRSHSKLSMRKNTEVKTTMRVGMMMNMSIRSHNKLCMRRNTEGEE
jgi:hypothetical protein